MVLFACEQQTALWLATTIGILKQSNEPRSAHERRTHSVVGYFEVAVETSVCKLIRCVDVCGVIGIDLTLWCE